MELIENVLFSNSVNDTETAIFRNGCNILDVRRENKIFNNNHVKTVLGSHKASRTYDALPRNTPMTDWVLGYLVLLALPASSIHRANSDGMPRGHGNKNVVQRIPFPRSVALHIPIVGRRHDWRRWNASRRVLRSERTVFTFFVVDNDSPVGM